MGVGVLGEVGIVMEGWGRSGLWPAGWGEMWLGAEDDPDVGGSSGAGGSPADAESGTGDAVALVSTDVLVPSGSLCYSRCCSCCCLPELTVCCPLYPSPARQRHPGDLLSRTLQRDGWPLRTSPLLSSYPLSHHQRTELLKSWTAPREASAPGESAEPIHHPRCLLPACLPASAQPESSNA